MRKKKHRILRERAGTTLVETLVSLLLMSILIGMAARVLSGAYRVYLRAAEDPVRRVHSGYSHDGGAGSGK